MAFQVAITLKNILYKCAKASQKNSVTFSEFASWQLWDIVKSKLEMLKLHSEKNHLQSVNVDHAGICDKIIYNLFENLFWVWFANHVFRGNVKMKGEITGTTPVAKATVVPRDAASVSVCVHV